MSEHHNLYLVRHAQSEFNIAQMRAKQSEHEVYRSEEDLGVKFDHSLLDCSISAHGYEQISEASQKLKDVNVRFMLSSPLRRCLQTTLGLAKLQKSSPEVIVWPILKEFLSSSCDMSDDIETIKKEFPTFDFSLFEKFPCPELWLLYTIKNEQLSNDLLKEIFEKYPKREDALKHAKTFIVERLREICPNILETQIDLNNRIMDVKAALKEKLKELKEGEAIVVVSHSRFLESFTAERYEEDGTPVGSKWLANCEVLPFDLN